MENSRVTGEAESLLHKIKNGTSMTTSEQLRLVMCLSLPSVMSQITSIIMQYIDAAMVGQLGAVKFASIGLVSTSTRLFGGLYMAAAAGFSVRNALVQWKYANAEYFQCADVRHGYSF